MGKRLLAPTVSRVPWMKGIVYGIGGSGKTTFLFSFNDDERTGPALILNASGNPEWLTVTNPNTVVIDLERPEDIDLPWSFLYNKQPAKHPFRTMYDIPADLTFTTLGIDTFTDWQYMLVDTVTGQQSNVSLTDVRGPSLKEYQPILSKTLKPVRELFKVLPMNVILVLQERTRLNLEDGSEASTPALVGHAREQSMAYANFVANFALKNVKGEILPAMVWKAGRGSAYTKNQWVPSIKEDGMVAPTATKLFDLAEKYL